MALSNTSRTKCFPSSRHFHLLVVMGALLTAPAGLAEDPQGTHRYKMVSSIEYTGKGQFRNHVETLFTIGKHPLPDNKVQYSLSLADYDPNVVVSSPSSTLSFILDRNTRHLSGYSEDMALWAKVNNESIKSLIKVTKDNVGKTWKQSIDLSSLGGSLPPTLKFTLAAIEVRTDEFGQMVAVRAL